MKSEITVRTEGIKGGKPSFENKGCVTIFATDKGQSRSDLEIVADSFVGHGSEYRRREKTLINVFYERNIIFTGTIEEFVAKLGNKNTQNTENTEIDNIKVQKHLDELDDQNMKIQYIKNVIGTFGSTNVASLGLVNLVVLKYDNITELIEEFFVDHVSVVIYNGVKIIGYNEYSYDSLSKELIDKIYSIIQNYELSIINS